jgi:hypothetical protein
MQGTDIAISETRPSGGEPAGLDPGEVCTLSEGGIVDRMAWVRNAILPHVLETRRIEDGLGIEFEGTPQLAQSLDRLIRLESECCDGITFERLAGGNPGLMRLEIRGIDPDAAMFRSFWTPQALEQLGKPVRLAKSIGAGSLMSLLVCCVLPAGAVALLGGAAAPLTSLDGPLPMAAGAVLGGAATWWWLGRRGLKTRGAESVGASCGNDC